MATKRWNKLQLSNDNPILLRANIFLRNKRLSGPYFLSRLVKNVADIFLLRFMVSAFTDTINDATLISEKSLVRKSVTRKSFEI